MTDGTRTGDRIIEFQVPVIIPGQRRDTVTFVRTKRCQCIGKFSGAPGKFPVIVTMQGIIGGY